MFCTLSIKQCAGSTCSLKTMDGRRFFWSSRRFIRSAKGISRGGSSDDLSTRVFMSLTASVWLSNHKRRMSGISAGLRSLPRMAPTAWTMLESSPLRGSTGEINASFPNEVKPFSIIRSIKASGMLMAFARSTNAAWDSRMEADIALTYALCPMHLPALDASFFT